MKMRDWKFRIVALLACVALLLIGERSTAEPAVTAQPMRLGIQIPASLVATNSAAKFDAAMICTGMDYIRSVSPGPVDIVHLKQNSKLAKAGDYDCVIRLNRQATASPADPGREGYRIKTLRTKPVVLEVAASSHRGLLYGLYRVGELVQSSQPLAGLNLQAVPKVPHRLAELDAMVGWEKHFRPGMFWQSVREFPRLGLNGVFIIPGKLGGSPVGQVPLPLHFEGRRVVADEPEASEWREVFQRLKAYGQDVYVLIPPLIPPGFSHGQIRDYYDGKIKLDGYETAVTEAMSSWLNTLFAALPQLDGVVLHSLELNDLREGDVSIFPCRDVSAGLRALNAFFTALTNTCHAHGKTPVFWTHVAGLDGGSIIQMRQFLLGRRDLITLEDAYWPNGGWPFEPFMGYLPDWLRREMCERARLGVILTTTDGEYYGGGKLPVAWPERCTEPAQAALDGKAEMVMVRLNEHDETMHGTLFSTPAVMVEAACRNLWAPSPTLPEIWRDCYTWLYGAAAAPKVVRAFQRSAAIVRDGLTTGNCMLMDHEGINWHGWLPAQPAFNLFRKPGTPLAGNNYTNLAGEGLLLWQSDAKAIPIEEFRRRQAAAQQAAAEGLADIQAARPDLTESQFAELARCFEDAQVTLKAISLLGEASYQVNLRLDPALRDAGDTGNHDQLLAEAIEQLRRYADEVEARRGPDFLATHSFVKIRWQDKTITAPAMPVTLRYIADTYAMRLPTTDSRSRKEKP